MFFTNAHNKPKTGLQLRVRVKVRVKVRVSPREKILRGWCSRPERTGILNIHELACAYPCYNARQSLCFEDPVE
jgi:hypothetical protein